MECDINRTTTNLSNLTVIRKARGLILFPGETLKIVREIDDDDDECSDQNNISNTLSVFLFLELSSFLPIPFFSPFLLLLFL